MNDVIFKYYFKKNHKVYKCTLNYNELINILELDIKKDKKGQSYKKGHSYQLQGVKDALLKSEDLNIFKCDIYLNGEILSI